MSDPERIPHEFTLQVLGMQALELAWLRAKLAAQTAAAPIVSQPEELDPASKPDGLTA